MRPDYYALEVINPPPDAAEDEVNILFIFYCSKSLQRISFNHFRNSSRARTANAWLNLGGRGLEDVSQMAVLVGISAGTGKFLPLPRDWDRIKHIFLCSHI